MKYKKRKKQAFENSVVNIFPWGRYVRNKIFHDRKYFVLPVEVFGVNDLWAQCLPVSYEHVHARCDKRKKDGEGRSWILMC